MIQGRWDVEVFSDVYQIEFHRFGKLSREQRLETESLLKNLLLLFDSAIHEHIHDMLLDICETADDMFVFRRGREYRLSKDILYEEVERLLETAVWHGNLQIHKLAPRGEHFARSGPFKQSTPERAHPPRAVLPPREQVEPSKKTWFAARFVDDIGVWIDGLLVKMEVNGATHDLTTDKTGVVELREQTGSTALVWVTDIPQAERILVDRLKGLDEAPAPTARDVVDYPVREPAKRVVLSPETPRTIVLGLKRTWIEVRVVDDNEKPIAGKRARLHLTDGRVVEQMLGPNGLLRADEIPAGICKFVLPVRDRAEWIDPGEPAPAQDPKELPEGHWIVRKRIQPAGPEVPNLRTGERHTVVIGRKIVEQLEIDDALFRLSSAVLLPEGQNPGADPTEPDGTRPTVADLLAASLRYAELHPDRKILITGHADTSGGDEYNQDLSEYRAAAVYAVLANDNGSREEFGDLCHGPHLQGKEKKQQVLYDDRVQVLNWVAATFGWPCSTNGEYGDYLRAVKAFQSTYNTEGNDGYPIEQLSVDGDFGPAMWRSVFDCYQVHLSERLEIMSEELQELQARVRPQFLKTFVGCGENKPKEMAGVDNYRSQTNRRVEVLYFEPPDHLPETPCLSGDCDPGACELYDRRWYFRKRLSTKEFRVASLWVRLRMSPRMAANSRDALHLWASPLTYDVTKTVCNSFVANPDSIDVEFAEVPQATYYSLEVLCSDGSSYLVFRDIPFSALRDEHLPDR